MVFNSKGRSFAQFWIFIVLPRGGLYVSEQCHFPLTLHLDILPLLTVPRLFQSLLLAKSTFLAECLLSISLSSPAMQPFTNWREDPIGRATMQA